ncbi:hypothetical protein OE88DRAFT_1665959 [Heliocybe sulcata]|uniref:Uncharacterized protein n=1 Tax=Heliocybe sulcata TaxID=5364 RepID=A0A5C3MPD3_9AGAM|nr:hypothetical protein OE88DRAFT_1665959 [Heliocybe sulcata]
MAQRHSNSITWSAITPEDGHTPLARPRRTLDKHHVQAIGRLPQRPYLKANFSHYRIPGSQPPLRAAEWISAVKRVLRGRPEVYIEFDQLINTYLNGELDHFSAIQRVCALLHDTGPLWIGFNTLLPQELYVDTTATSDGVTLTTITISTPASPRAGPPTGGSGLSVLRGSRHVRA